MNVQKLSYIIYIYIYKFIGEKSAMAELEEKYLDCGEGEIMCAYSVDYLFSFM